MKTGDKVWATAPWAQDDVTGTIEEILAEDANPEGSAPGERYAVVRFDDNDGVETLLVDNLRPRT